MDPATYVAIIAALFGGAGVKLLEKWLSRNTVKEDTATKLRSELREELIRLRSELDKTEEELDSTRKKYYDMLEAFSKVKLQLEEALHKIKMGTEQAGRVIGTDPE